jgi:hypothetical protein
VSGAALLREAAQVGVTVRLVEGKPKVAGNPPPELLARLREHKPEIVEILKADRCRWCGEILRWPGPVGVVLGDGLAECMPCVDREVARIWASAERAVESPDALSDPAEVMLRGEIP